MRLYCQICAAEISPERATKKARTCSVECQKQYNAQKAAQRDTLICRLCGRRFRRGRNQQPVNTVHNRLNESGQPAEVQG